MQWTLGRPLEHTQERYYKIKQVVTDHSSHLQSYFEPNAGRSNLRVLTGATATRITFVPGSNPLRADSVEFLQGGNKYKVAVSKEVILSAGKTLSPRPS